MLFSSSVPEAIKDYPNVPQFLSVLDGLQVFKSSAIFQAIRLGNSSINMNSKWLIKKLNDIGVKDIPDNYPIAILIQYLLNADTVFLTRGSKIGIELYCSLLSLGTVTIDDSNFYTESELFSLDSISQGTIVDDNTQKVFYLCEDSSLIEQTSELSINIASKYFDGSFPEESDLIKSYISSTIGLYLGFSPNRIINYTYESAESFYYHNLLNPYFRNE